MTIQKGLLIASIIVFILGMFASFGVNMELLGLALFAGSFLS